MLPAVQHITSWRKTGKYAGPATSPRTSIKSLSSLFRSSKAFKEEETFFLSMCVSVGGFRSTNVSLFCHVAHQNNRLHVQNTYQVEYVCTREKWFLYKP